MSERSSTIQPQVDIATIKSVIESLCASHAPFGVTELRGLEVNADRYPETHSGFFDADHFGEMARHAHGLTTTGKAKGVYWGINPVDPRLLSRVANRARKVPAKGDAVSDANIVRLLYLPIDCDPERPSGISSTDDEHATSIEQCEDIANCLGEEGWPEPIKGDSGNGGHCLYAIDLLNLPESRLLIERAIKGIAAKFPPRSDSAVKVSVDTTVFNPSRILKLYGTWVRKGDSTTERPHRIAKLLHVPDERIIVPPDLLEDAASKAPAEKGKTAYSFPSSNGNSVHSTNGATHEANGVVVYDPSAWTLEQKASRCRKYLASVPGAEEGNGGHKRTYQTARIIWADFAVDDPDAWTIFQEWNQTCQPPWDEKDLRRKLDEAIKKDGDRGSKLGKPPRSKGKGKREKKAPTIPAALPTPIDLDEICAEYALTDTGNAERFRTRFGHLVRYCFATKRWYWWDGQRFKCDDSGTIDRLMKQTCRSMYNEVATLEDGDQSEKLAQHAMTSESAISRERAAKLARSDGAHDRFHFRLRQQLDFVCATILRLLSDRPDERADCGAVPWRRRERQDDLRERTVRRPWRRLQRTDP